MALGLAGGIGLDAAELMQIMPLIDTIMVLLAAILGAIVVVVIVVQWMRRRG